MSASRLLDVSHDHDSVEVVDGYGAEVRVETGHLVLKNGDFGSADRFERWIARGRCHLERLVILSHEGAITLAAVEWLAELHVATIVLDRTGRLIFCSPTQTRHDAELRRTQAVAGISDRGLEIAAWIVGQKLRAQGEQLRKIRKTLPDHFGAGERATKCETAEHDIRLLLDREPQDLQGLLLLEGRGAQLYWSALEGQRIPWARQSATRIPRHWVTIQPRTSGFDGLSRDARDPFGAAVNYIYAILEAECKIAAAKIGLDLSFGFLHVDEVNRQSFIYDLMEPARSFADDLALSLFFKWRERDTPIKNASFIELRNGVCRLAPDFARTLIDFVQAPLRSVAERVAEDFTRILRSKVYTLKLAPRQNARHAAKTPPVKRSACEYCRGPMHGQGSRFCGRACFLRWSVEVNRPIEKAQAKLSALRAAGKDPSHGGNAAKKRSTSNKSALAETWSWRRSEAGQAEARKKRAAQARVRRSAKKWQILHYNA